MFVHVETEFWSFKLLVNSERWFKKNTKHTIIAKQELIVSGSKHSYWSSILAALDQLSMSRILFLRKRDTTKTVYNYEINL
jgi:hypothetical protein